MRPAVLSCYCGLLATYSRLVGIGRTLVVREVAGRRSCGSGAAATAQRSVVDTGKTMMAQGPNCTRESAMRLSSENAAVPAGGS